MIAMGTQSPSFLKRFVWAMALLACVVGSTRAHGAARQSYQPGSPIFEKGVLQPERARISIGDFSVGRTGAAIFKIPIMVPPGTAGVQPDLALVYNSQAGNGLVGVGWRLTGLSTMTRCRQTIAQDGWNGAVTYSASDRFCLDGLRLVAVNGPYGADGTEYRTEKDTFVKIVSHGSTGSGPEFFTVKTKEGKALEYGNSTDSRIEAVQSEVRVWALNRVQDTSGNYLTVSYYESDGDFRPHEIEYTMNMGGGLTQPSRRILFAYESRSDVPMRFVAGTKIEMKYRLTSIRTFAKVGGIEKQARDYRLSYETGTTYTNRSRVVAITECVTSRCYDHEPFEFRYQDATLPGADFRKEFQSLNLGSVINGDFNGDGRVDFLAKPSAAFEVFLSSAGTGDDTFVPEHWGTGSVWDGNKVWRGDFNGDGLTDVVTNVNDTFYTYFSSGTAFQSAVSGGANNNVVMQKFAWTGDFNGDGRSDIVTLEGADRILTHISQGNGRYVELAWTRPAGAKWSGDQDRFWVGDIDGDRMSDLISYKDHNLHLYRSQGDGTYLHSTYAVDDAEWSANFAWVGDYNGDGLIDLVSKKTLDDDFNTYFSKGDGTFAVMSYATPIGAGWAGKNVWVGDFNGDGLTDLMSKKNGQFHKYFSKGDGSYHYFGAETFTSSQFDDQRAWTGDVNGDGLVDVVSYTGTNSTYTYFTDEPFPDLLTAITNPLQGEYFMTYRPLSDAAVYTKGSGAVYPTVDVAVPVYVLAHRTTSNGCEDDDHCGQSYDFSYEYEALRFDLEGRGNLGFETVRMEDLSGTNIMRETSYLQEFPFEGLVDTVAIWDRSDGRLLHEVQNTWVARQPDPDVSVSFVALEGVNTLECDGAANCRTLSRTMEYDDFGNHEKTVYHGVISETGDEYEDETIWAVDEANWLHRPITRIIRDFDGTELRKTWFYYDGNNSTLGQLGSRGLETREERDLGGGQGHAANPKKTVVYDTFGNRASMTDPLGCTTSWTYDSTKTFPVSETSCLADNTIRATTTSEWDERWGVRLSETDSNSNETTFYYDDAGQLEKVVGPLDTEWRPLRRYDFYVSSYAKYNKVETEQPIKHNNNYILYEYEYFDGLGRVWHERTRGPSNAEVARIIEYDSRNLIKKASAPKKWVLTLMSGYDDFTTYTYDPLGRVTNVLFPDGTSVRTTYSPDPASGAMIVEVTDQRGNKTRRFLDAYGRAIRVEEDNVENGQPVTYVTRYTYNALGQLQTTENHLGQVGTIEYDKLGRKTRQDDPDTGVWTFSEYDVAGNLVEQTDAKGNTITFRYDMRGRVTQKSYSGGAGTVAWAYDDPNMANSKGRLTKVTDLAGSETYEYDAMGRVTEQVRKIGTDSYSVRQTWNALNQLDTKTFPDGDTIRYSYNTAGWLYGIAGVVNRIDYNERGQITKIRFGNWKDSARAYYDHSSRLKSMTVAGVQELEYAYDAKGNVTRITDFIGTASRDFTYDNLDRLIQASGTFGGNGQANVVETYAYDALGNFTEKAGVSYEYGVQNNRTQSTRIGGTVQRTFAYDANGNMTENGTDHYEWDRDNRLASVNGTVHFAYDYTGRRVQKGSTLYPFADYEVDAQGTQVKYFKVNGELVGVKEDDGAPEKYRFYHADHLGGTHVITDEDGLIDQIVEYDPWGRIARESSALDNLRKFTGQEFDEETGLYYYVGRYYDASLGRFTRPDPVVSEPFNSQNLNRYSYVLNNPATLTDPSGFEALCNCIFDPYSAAPVSSDAPDISPILGGDLQEFGSLPFCGSLGCGNSNQGLGTNLLRDGIGLLAQVESARAQGLLQIGEVAAGSLFQYYTHELDNQLALTDASIADFLVENYGDELLALHEIAKDANASANLTVGSALPNAPFGGYLGFTVDPDGLLTLQGGVGFAVGSFGGLTLAGQAEVRGGTMHQFRLMDIMVVYAAPFGGLHNAYASLTGAAAGGGIVIGGGGLMVFTGPTYSHLVGNISQFFPNRK